MSLASFFKRYIPKFANISLSITILLKVTVDFKWIKEFEEAFLIMKDKLAEKPVFSVQNPKAFKTELHTDASNKGIGAILLQAEEESSPFHMVYAVSRRNSKIVETYHSSKLELMIIT